MQKRLVILRYFIIVICGILGLSLFYLQIIQGAYFRKRSLENRLQVIPLRAPRGKIFDRNGRLLVANRPSFTVLFSGLNLPDLGIRETIQTVSPIIGVAPEVLENKVRRQAQSPLIPIHFAEDIDRQTLVHLAEISHNLAGIMLEVESVREYIYGDFASHIIGYLGEIDREELANLEGYRLGQIIGKAGIEREFDRQLRGIDGGKHIEIDARGKQMRFLGWEEAIAGSNLRLTIDFELQKLAEDALEGKKGSIVILDPRSGEIRALVSKPSFNPDFFLKRLTRSQCEELFVDPEHPLLNRAIQGQYPPGSTFKIVTALAAIEEGEITPETVFDCKGEISIGRRGKVFHCWKEGGHGKLDLHQAIVESCDLYFYRTGLLLGPDSLAKYAKMMGLGRVTRINLEGEKPGVVPDPHWKKETVGQSWFSGDTVNFSIGQGYVLVTPLQMANLIACLATRGKVYRPYLVKEVVSGDGKVLKSFKPVVAREVKLSPRTYQILTDGLEGVVAEEEGTGRFARLKGLRIAGKTGTAENPFGREHAWFVCFAPIEAPRIAMCVFVENGGHGAVAAAPLAGQILKRFF